MIVKRKLPRGFFVGIRNSKAVSESKRVEWYLRARSLRKRGALDFAVSFSGERYIDEHGIVRAVQAAIARSLWRLKVSPERVQIYLDGSIYAPRRFQNQKTIVRGDELVPLISLASIIAKVRRDSRMRRFAKKFPVYGFERHVGYGTSEHYRAIEQHGLCELHRRSFLKSLQNAR